MALTEHAKLAVFVDQTKLKEVTSIDIQWESGQQRVEGILRVCWDSRLALDPVR